MRLMMLALVVLAGAAAGCGSGADEKPTSKPEEATAFAPSTPVEDEAGPPRADLPSWAVGDWWLWEIESELFGSYRVTTVVAERDEDGYEVGVSELDAGLRSIWFHLPPQGRVEAEALAWEMHDLPAALLVFPLADGMTWHGEIESDLVVFHAAQRGGSFDVTGEYEGGGQAVAFRWSPSADNFEEIALFYGSASPWATARLVEHGTGHVGKVHILAADDVLLAGAATPGAPQPPRAFSVPPEAARVVIGCYLSGGPGAFSIRFVPPGASDPLECAHDNLGSDRTSGMVVIAAPAVAGEWKALFAPVGQGFVSVEISAVRVREVVIEAVR